MNPLEKHAHLFANGEFRIKDEYDHVKPLEGVHNNRLLSVNPPYGLQAHFANQCTLIARPIENMTHNEVRSVYIESVGASEDSLDEDWGMSHRDDMIRYWTRKANKDQLRLSTARALGSVGIYFGPQTHFDDVTVIDSRKIESQDSQLG